jgi:hypothetical protein
VDGDEEELAEVLLRILSGMVDVFTKLSKMLSAPGEETKVNERDIKIEEIISTCSTNNTLSPQHIRSKTKSYTEE